MGGSSIPPMKPILLDLVIPPAIIPARNVPSSMPKTIGTTLPAADTRSPDVTTKIVLGYSAPIRSAGPWNSKPCPNTRLYPCWA